jgi:hypothetical protein
VLFFADFYAETTARIIRYFWQNRLRQNLFRFISAYREATIGPSFRPAIFTIGMALRWNWVSLRCENPPPHQQESVRYYVYTGFAF